MTIFNIVLLTMGVKSPFGMGLAIKIPGNFAMSIRHNIKLTRNGKQISKKSHR